MKVLIVEPGKYPREADIEKSIKTEEKIIGCAAHTAYPWRDRVCILCADEENFETVPLNRYIDGYGIVPGTFIVCGFDGEDITDLTPQQCKYYEKKLHNPQRFFIKRNTLYMDAVRPEDYKQLAVILGTSKRHEPER